MRKTGFMVLFLCGFVFALENAYYGDDFMKLEWGAKNAALGGVSATGNPGTQDIYYNPAGLSGLPDRQFLGMHASHFGNEWTYDLAAFAFPLHSSLGIGFGLTRAGVQGIQDTRNLEVDERGVPVFDPARISYLSSIDNILYLAVGKQVLRTLSIGGTAKMFVRSLGEIHGYGAALDLNAWWNVNRDLGAGLFLRNASTVYTTWQTGSSETVFPKAILGLSYLRSAPYFYGDFSFYLQSASLISSEAVAVGTGNDPSKGSLLDDPKTWLKSGNAGVEYTYQHFLSLRAGVNPVYDFTAGAGVAFRSDGGPTAFRTFLQRLSIRECRFDYALLKSPEFLPSNLLSLSLSF